MARRRRRGIGRTTVARAGLDKIWAVTIFDATAVDDSPIVEVNAVLPEDWEGGTDTLYHRGATLLGIRGWISAGLGGSSTTSGALFVTCYKFDVSLTSAPDPATAAAMGVTDVLWTGGHIGVASAGPAQAAYNSIWTEQLEIKSRRKLTSQDSISFCMRTTASTRAYNVSGVIRALIGVR